jgi:hypothetical protein
MHRQRRIEDLAVPRAVFVLCRRMQRTQHEALGALREPWQQLAHERVGTCAEIVGQEQRGMGRDHGRRRDHDRRRGPRDGRRRRGGGGDPRGRGDDRRRCRHHDDPGRRRCDRFGRRRWAALVQAPVRARA